MSIVSSWNSLIVGFMFHFAFFSQDYFAAGGKWLHVDCAGPAFAEDRGTGYGVALLSQLTQRLN